MAFEPTKTRIPPHPSRLAMMKWELTPTMTKGTHA